MSDMPQIVQKNSAFPAESARIRTFREPCGTDSGGRPTGVQKIRFAVRAEVVSTPYAHRHTIVAGIPTPGGVQWLGVLAPRPASCFVVLVVRVRPDSPDVPRETARVKRAFAIRCRGPPVSPRLVSELDARYIAYTTRRRRARRPPRAFTRVGSAPPASTAAALRSRPVRSGEAAHWAASRRPRREIDAYSTCGRVKL